VKILINWYTNSTKENQFQQTDVEITGMRMEELTIDRYYENIKEDERFA